MFTYTITNLTNERINYFKIGLDLPTDATFSFWQSNVRQVDNYIELISNDYTYIGVGVYETCAVIYLSW